MTRARTPQSTAPNGRTNGHVVSTKDMLQDGIRRAAHGVLAGCAYRLNNIDRHGIDLATAAALFDDPVELRLMNCLQLFRVQHKDATSAPASALCRFIVGIPELRDVLLEKPQHEIALLFDHGPYDADMVGPHLDVLRAAAFDRNKLQLFSTVNHSIAEPWQFIATVEDQLNSLRKLAGENGGKGPFEVITSAEFATSAYSLEYLIPGVLVKGQPAALGGGKKNLKTTILVDLVLSLASGAKFLGEFSVARAVRVGIMSGESGAATIQETARRVAKSKPWIHLEEYSNVIWSFDLPKLGQPDTVRILTRFIQDHALEVLVIDPLYLALVAGDVASNLYSMGAKLIDLTAVIRATGCTIILAHHSRKVAKGDFTRFAPPELDDLAYAGISEWVRQWLLVGRRSEYDPENGGHHELWLAAGGSAGHSGLWALDIDEGTRQDTNGRRWDVKVMKASEARRASAEAKQQHRDEAQRQRDEADTAKVVKMLGSYPAGAAFTKIRDKAGVQGLDLRRILNNLVEQGTAEECTYRAANHQEYEGYRLVTRSSGHTRNHSDKPDESGCTPHTRITLPLLRGEYPSECVCPSPEESSETDGLSG